MFHIKFDEKRDREQGQYFVELTKNRDLDVVNCDRLGYWCDKRHLEHFLREMLKHFSALELIKMLKD